VVVPILQKVGANVARIRERLGGALDKLPKQSGGARPSSRELNAILARAEEEARALGRVRVGGAPAAGAGVAEGEHEPGAAGVGRARAGTAWCGGWRRSGVPHRVTGQDPEQQYRALERFSRDLTALARQGKLDPVIGRDEEIRRVSRS
jgi:ATP-dependent Clp protease ATP-binding subunit ClpB